jgi:tRNA(fMet)-specific endonuclease VapC
MKGLHDLKNKILKVGAVNCFISEISLAELKFGVENSHAKEKNAAVLANFLTGITVIPIFTSLDIYAKEKARLRKAGRKHSANRV